MLSVIELFGGVGLFLFGMSLMGSSLEKIAGSGLQKILETLTTSKKKGVGVIKGWALGLGVTGVIQSSAATTIMLIGFVNAGIMRLSQAIPVVFGANVGSTMTAQILRLGDIGSGNIVLKLLKPSSFSPMLIAVGAAMLIFSKKQKYKDLAGIFIGLGTLFLGMTKMEAVFAPLKESPAFQKFFTSFSNPFIGIFTGIALTAVIQSSSAFVGILQALSATGSISYATAVPLILGQNIGKCSAILLGSIGANKKAKRVALSYILFNIIMVVAFTVLIYAFHYTIGIKGFDKIVNRSDIANVHLLFNLITSIVLLPFASKMSDLTGKLLKDTDESSEDKELKRLDDMLLKTPVIALQQCKVVMKLMSEKIKENYEITIAMLDKYDAKEFTKLNDNESFIDKCETYLSRYVVRIDRKRFTAENEKVVNEVLNSIGDYERIGDYCMNMAYVIQDKHDEKILFTKTGKKEVTKLIDDTRKVMDAAFDAFDDNSHESALEAEKIADEIVKYNETVKHNHIERLKKGKCSVEAGTSLYDMLNCFERIAMHAKNV
ncbi:MAG: Na/Pi cotransporter family protein, partial [Lachnospiraceae bacterium]|nr:Na/Pi cotransporter family protein [Lachnospiraceae bacterium]